MHHHTSPVGRWLLALALSLTFGIALEHPTHAIERALPNGDVVVPTELLPTVAVARAVFDLDCLTESTCITASDPAMRTSDGGRTWHRLVTAGRSPRIDVSDVACPTATTCIGSLPYTGLVRTTDAGVTWTVVPDGPTTRAVTCPTSTRCIGLDVRSSSATFVTASLDAGLTWTEPMQASIPLSAMECGTTTFCASISNRSIATSVDGGVSWNIRTTLADEFPADLACAGEAMCIATSSSHVVVVTPTGVAQYDAPSARGETAHRVTCASPNRCVVTGVNTDGLPVVSAIDPANGSSSSVVLAEPAGSISYIDCDDATCVAVSAGRTAPANSSALAITHHSSDGGSTWTSVIDQNRTERHLDLACPAPDTCIVVGDNGAHGDPAPLFDSLNVTGLVRRTTDGGRTWNPVGLPGIVRTITYVDCVPSVCLASGWADVPGGPWAVLRSTDLGATWSLAAPPVTTNQPPYPECADTTCFLTVQPPLAAIGEVYRSTDLGLTWGFRSQVQSYPFVCATADRCIANDAGGRPLATSDGASTWTSATLPPGVTVAIPTTCTPTRCFASVPGGTPAMLQSGDGVTWTAAPIGLEPSAASCIADRCIAIGRSGIGLLRDLGVDLALTAGLPITPTAVEEVRGLGCASRTSCFALLPLGLGGTMVLRLDLERAPVRTVSPARLLDTRAGAVTADGQHQGVGAVRAGSTYRLPVRGRAGIAADATSATLTVTVAQPTAPGFVTAFPCDLPVPNASNLNYRAGAFAASTVTVPFAADGTVCFYTHATTELIIDANAFVPGDAAGTVALAPARLLETRSGIGMTTVDGRHAGVGQLASGTPYVLDVTGRGGVPSDADAVTVTVTAVDPSDLGYVTAYPCDQPRPNASNLNHAHGETVANAVLLPVTANGTVCLFSRARTDLVVDVNAYVPDRTNAIRAVTPARLLDTRIGDGIATVDGRQLGQGPVGSAGVALFALGRGGVPPGARTVMLTVTATDALAPSYLTIAPCSTGPPNASNVNVIPGQTVANAVIAEVQDGPPCIWSLYPTHVIVDVNGYSY